MVYGKTCKQMASHGKEFLQRSIFQSALKLLVPTCPGVYSLEKSNQATVQIFMVSKVSNQIPWNYSIVRVLLACSNICFLVYFPSCMQKAWFNDKMNIIFEERQQFEGFIPQAQASLPGRHTHWALVKSSTQISFCLFGNCWNIIYDQNQFGIQM